MKPSNKTEIAAARAAADQASDRSGRNESEETWAANRVLAEALDKGNLVDRLFR